MTDVEELEELRDRIVSTAPEAIKQMFDNDPWKVALYCAKAYFQASEDASEKTTVTEEIDMPVSREILFRMGFDVRYIAAVYKESVEQTVQALQITFPVIVPDKGKLMNLGIVNESSKRTDLQDRITMKAVKMKYTPMKPTAKRVDFAVCRSMFDAGWALGDIAKMTGLLISEIGKGINGNALSVTTVAIIKEFMKDRNVAFIAQRLDVNPADVITTLNQWGYHVSKYSDHIYWMDDSSHFRSFEMPDEDDFEVLDRMEEKGASIQQMASAVGVGDKQLEEMMSKRNRQKLAAQFK